MNGEVCCILGICCPPDSEQQRVALGKEVVKGTGLDVTQARIAGDWVLANFDLAPKGSLAVMTAEIARLARQNPQ